ncbi:MAG: TonB-dependent receptor [Polyangiaceae bacterium]|nr:TonB-dependent receptor [Polyangiaceae bacterium]
MSLTRALALVVALAPRAALAEEVVVHGKRPQPSASRRDATVASTVIPKARLERPGTDSAAVLSEVAGVQVARTGSSSDLSTASLRGATSAETPVYLAGIRINDDLTGTADLSTVPLWMLDRVEVFRGAAPVDADRAGIGGAVFFEPRLPRKTRVGAGAGVGSFGERSAWLGGGVVAPGARAAVALRSFGARNDYEYLDDGGTAAVSSDDREVRRPNADFSAYDAWALGRTELGPGARVTTVLNAFDREQGVTGLGVIPAQHARARVRRVLAGVSTRVPCSTQPGEPCVLSLSTTAIVASHAVRDPARELAIGAPEVVSRGERVSQDVALTQQLSPVVALRVGVGQELERLRIVERRSLSARRNVSRAATTLSVAPVRSLRLTATGALACHGTRGPDQSDSCGVLTPTGRAGARVELLRGLALLGNVGHGERVPTLGELFGVSAVVLGNPALSPERGEFADVGVRAELRPGETSLLFADAFGFVRVARELIAYRRSGLGVVRPYNVGRARFVGLELTAGADLFSHLRLSSALTALDPRDTTPGRSTPRDLVPYQSRLVVASRAELYTALGFVDRLALGATSRYRSSRVADPAGLIIIAEQHVLDADVTARFWQERIGVALAVNNAFDARHFDAVGLPLPGRSLHASGELWW